MVDGEKVSQFGDDPVHVVGMLDNSERFRQPILIRQTTRHRLHRWPVGLSAENRSMTALIAQMEACRRRSTFWQNSGRFLSSSAAVPQTARDTLLEVHYSRQHVLARGRASCAGRARRRYSAAALVVVRAARNRLPDLVGCRRHVDVGDAERTQRIENGADDGRRCTGCSCFAGALDAERIGRRRHLRRFPTPSRGNPRRAAWRSPGSCRSPIGRSASNTINSINAWPTPCATPPWIWPSHSNLLITMPTSSTAA